MNSRREAPLRSSSSTGDPRWQKASEPLREYLREPRSWPQLEAWAASHRVDGHMLRNQLAWLEGSHQAFEQGGLWRARGR